MSNEITTGMNSVVIYFLMVSAGSFLVKLRVGQELFYSIALSYKRENK